MSKKLIKIEVWECVCDKCGHIWQTKTDTPPKVCPRCKNLTWDKFEEASEIVEQDWGA